MRASPPCSLIAQRANAAGQGAGIATAAADQPIRWGDQGMAGLVKVFGCRPSQVERAAWGRRTETAQARTRGTQVRRYGDLKILVRLNGWRIDCEKRFAGVGWW